MNFRAASEVKYYMKKFFPKIRLFVCLALCVAICVAAPCLLLNDKKSSSAASPDKTVLRVWQIDCFEGGKGSRADFLQSVGNGFSKQCNCYISVLSLSSEAAVRNLANGNVPDLISYGAGMCGIESYIDGYAQWCYGSYCILTLDSSSDFSDMTAKNTVINAGKENLVNAAALFCGVCNATTEKSTGAYVSLINGKYKYLLGTQRDIFRLKTRGVSFAVKPVTEFNDLYQNISVTAKGDRADCAESFIEYLLSRKTEVNKIGMLSAANGLYDDEMRVLEDLEYECRLTSPVSGAVKSQLEKLISDGDINKLKNLLK